MQAQLRIHGAGFLVEGWNARFSLVCGVQGAECRVQGVGFRVQGSGCRVQGAECRAKGSGCMVHDTGFRVRVYGLLSSKPSTYKTVKARFWPWPSGKKS